MSVWVLLSLVTWLSREYMAMFVRSEWFLKITAMHNHPSQHRLLVSNPVSYCQDCILSFKVKHIVVVSSKQPHPNLIHKPKPKKPKQKTLIYQKTPTLILHLWYLFFLSILTDTVYVILTHYNLFRFTALPVFWCHPFKCRFLKIYLAFRTISSWFSLFWVWNEATCLWFRSLSLQLQYLGASWSFLTVSCEAGRIFTDNKLRRQGQAYKDV